MTTKRLLLYVAVAAAVSCAPQQAPTQPTSAPPASPVRILVFNIHAGKDAAGVANLERVADLIRSTDADVALLQEVDKGTKRSGGVDQTCGDQQTPGLHAGIWQVSELRRRGVRHRCDFSPRIHGALHQSTACCAVAGARRRIARTTRRADSRSGRGSQTGGAEHASGRVARGGLPAAGSGDRAEAGGR